MFKALNKLNGGEIIILDPRWRAQLSTMRALDHQDALACPYCERPVRVRAGQYKRWHFAHKHLENCLYENESPLLLQLRAILYEWLVGKFGSQSVTLEKQLKYAGLPRHIDCWVKSGTQYFAYWIFETRKPPRIREILADGFSKITAQTIYLFATDLLNLDPLRRDCLYLTTTERAFMVETPYDHQKQTEPGYPGRSLHYLDPQTKYLTTFRGLHLYHSPQLYRGSSIKDIFSEVKVSLTSGEFLHPEEYEMKQKPINPIKESNDQPQTANLPRRFWGHDPAVRSPHKILPDTTASITQGWTSIDDLSDRDFEPSQLPECIFCGRKSGDYWYYDRTSNTCKCRSCYQDGEW